MSEAAEDANIASALPDTPENPHQFGLPLSCRTGSTAGSRNGQPKLMSIQLLRAAAAIAVVFTHAITRIGYTFPEGVVHSRLASPTSQLLVGDAGVDVFFVISGFIMYYIHHDDFGAPGAPAEFFKRRVLRIVPIYWLLTTAAIVVRAVLANLAVIHKPSIALWWVVSSYLFLPISAGSRVISPIIGVGWTLNYEMFFYVVFALAMFLSLQRGLSLVVILFVTTVAGGTVLNPSTPPGKFFSDWLLLDFLMGIGIAWWTLSRREMQTITRVCLVLLGLVGLAITLIWTPPEHGLLRFLLWGIPASSIVLGLCTANFPASKLSSVGEKLGDASYSIYLFQFFALPAIAIIMRHAGFRVIPFDLNVFILTGLVTLAGVGCWWAVERPLARSLKRLKCVSLANLQRRRTIAHTPDL